MVRTKSVASRQLPQGVDDRIFARGTAWFAWVGTATNFPGANFVGGGDDGADYWTTLSCPLVHGCTTTEADEYGRVVDGGAAYWSGFATPCVSTANCNEWSSADTTINGLIDLGAAFRGPSIQRLVQGNDVSDASVSVSCATRQRLWCIGGGRLYRGEPGKLVDAGHPERVVFVTSARFNGALGGVAGADVHCTNAALDAGLTDTFGAYLGGHWAQRRRRGLVGFTGWAQRGQQDVTFLNASSFSTTPRVALDRDEHGALLPADEPLWTGMESWGRAGE